MIKISIIIPYHNESEDVIKPLLKSINEQKNIDFNDIEILFINNCDNPLKPKCLSDNTFNNIQPRVKYLLSEIKNLSGMSRQCGIDNSNGKYLMFCDDDDILYDDLVICDLLKIVDTHTEDILRFKEIIENCKPNGELFTTEVLDRHTLIHGKLYKADYIKGNKITFSNILSVAEDNYFNLHVEAFPYKYAEIDRIIYVFKYNPNSVSRTSVKKFIKNCMISECFAIFNLTVRYYDRLPTNCFIFYIAELLDVYLRATPKKLEDIKQIALKTCCNLFYVCNISYEQFLKNNEMDSKIVDFIKEAFSKKKG